MENKNSALIYLLKNSVYFEAEKEQPLWKSQCVSLAFSVGNKHAVQHKMLLYPSLFEFSCFSKILS